MSSRLPLRRVRHALQLPAARLIVGLARLLPRGAIWSISRMVGMILQVLPLGSNRLIRSNLRLAMAEGDRPRTPEPREVYSFLLAGILDFFHLGRASDAAFASVVRVSGAGRMEQALSAGKGVLAVTAHYSAWELIPRAVVLLGHRVGVVSRKLSESRTSVYLDSLRTEPGVTVADRGSGARKILRMLEENTALGVLIDQDTMGVESDFVDFFGRPARTPVGMARLALRRGIPTVPLHIRREADGTYALVIEEPLYPEAYAGLPDGHLALTQDLTSMIERWVREDPRQWIWFHRRWARRPGD